MVVILIGAVKPTDFGCMLIGKLSLILVPPGPAYAANAPMRVPALLFTEEHFGHLSKALLGAADYKANARNLEEGSGHCDFNSLV